MTTTRASSSSAAFEASAIELGASRTGREGLSALASELHPDLLILDLVMPDIDGWMFRLEQRSQPSLRDIPVIVMSGDVSPKAAAIDADAYVQKPCRVERLLPLVDCAAVI